MLKVPNLLYEEKRLRNMTILINDVNFEKSTYGYGYGYGYGEQIKKPWHKKMFA